jgi:hypothetical protein
MPNWNFHDFQIAHMHETLPLVHIINSSTKGMGGTREVGPVTLIPALTNALFCRDRQTLSLGSAWSAMTKVRVK